MAQAGVTEEMMEAHLEEEKVYLDGLSVEPEEETDHMEYYQQLVNLADRRDHIAKALKARSKAIRNALNRYNTAAEVLDPPGRLLTWAEVVDYTFLSDFDILRNPDTTSSIRAWATPAAHQLLDSYCKGNLSSARERGRLAGESEVTQLTVLNTGF
ncbi:hypothetical protein K438DRAFT_1969669 [Mycena galopus ATCC 62051]|nr:hypothetical protein K438DRAFT_1969669 [Mycena galopus ATCC 62051]